MRNFIPVEERIGERHGKLIITGIAWKCWDEKGAYVTTECDCGKSAVQRLNTIVCGTSSCGCGLSDAGKRSIKILQSKRPKGLKGHVKKFEDTLITSLICAYRCGARNHKPLPVEFSLTREEFIELINGECFYCGEAHKDVKKLKPSRITADWVHKGKTYNCVGIDRVDSSKGYTKENCVPCCEECNRMKLNSSFERFIEKCKIIAGRF